MVSFSSGSSLARVLFRERNPSGNTTTMACLSLLRHGKAGRNMRYFKRMFLTTCLHFYATRLADVTGVVEPGQEAGRAAESPGGDKRSVILPQFVVAPLGPRRYTTPYRPRTRCPPVEAGRGH